MIPKLWVPKPLGLRYHGNFEYNRPWNLFLKAGMQGSNPQLEFSLTASFGLEGLKKALMLNRRSHDQLADWNGSISKLELIKLEFINKYSMRII